jgi:hypothetical protein
MPISAATMNTLLVLGGLTEDFNQLGQLRTIFCVDPVATARVSFHVSYFLDKIRIYLFVGEASLN